MRKTTNGTTPVATKFQFTNRSWTVTMPCVESVWLTSTTVATARPSAASYDTICADARTEPMQRVLRARRPTGEHHAVHRDRRHREHQEDADRRIGDLQVGVVPEDVDDAVVAVLEDTAERHDAERDERGDHREQRREAEHEQVGAFGQQVLLEEELDAVGQRLQHAPRPGDVRPDAVLHVGDELALEPDHQHHADEQHREREDDLERDDEHDREVDIAVEERIAAGRGEHVRHGVSTRTSVTTAVASIRSAARMPGRLKPSDTTPRATAGSAIASIRTVVRDDVTFTCAACATPRRSWSVGFMRSTTSDARPDRAGEWCNATPRS